MFVKGALYEIVDDNSFVAYYTSGEFMCHLGTGIMFVFLSYHRAEDGFFNGMTVLLPMVGHQAFMGHCDHRNPADWFPFVCLLAQPQKEESGE